MEVQPSPGAGHDLFIQNTDREAVLGLQIVRQDTIPVARFQADALGQAFGGVFKLGEMVLAGIQRIAHAFQHGTGPAGRRAGPRHAGGQVGCGRIHFAEGVEEAGKGLGSPRLGIGELGQFHPVHFHARQDRIGSGFLQVRDQLPVAFIGEGAHIHIESVGEGEQDACRHRALIAFQQVEIAGRQAQGFGRLSLGQAALAPQAAQAGTGKDLLEGLVLTHVCTKIYRVTSTQCNYHTSDPLYRKSCIDTIPAV